MSVFCLQKMKKTMENKLKEYKKKKGKIWVDIHTPYRERTTGSGLTFRGKYVDK